MAAITRTEHPHGTRREGVCGGSPTVAGSRIPVWQIAVWLRQGRSAEEVVAEYEGRLMPAHIYDAISYYYDHKDEIDHEVWEQTSDEALAEQLGRLGAEQGPDGMIRFGRARPMASSGS